MVSSHEEYEQLKERIAELSGYEPHPEEPYRLLYNNAYETLYFDENVSTRYIGRQIADILQRAPDFLERVVNILKRETQDPIKSKVVG